MHERPRILICDDEPQITASIKALLDVFEKYRIETTNSSRHALSMIQADAPDLVILDVMMPEMTGFQLLDSIDRLRTDSAFIMVTGESSVDTAIKAIRKGAVDYLRKPFEPDELVIRVENVLKQRRMRHEQLSVEAENRELEDRLRQSHKMEAIGTLAGGIAHDFNNVLSIILGNAELALTMLPESDDCYQNLEQIFEASLRAKDMIRQLLSFSRKEESSRRPLRINGVINESLKLLRASMPANICIALELDREDCTVIGDATQLHQILLNLCTNAAHAMEKDGGVLTLRVSSEYLDNTAAANLELEAGRFAHLIIADTGKGIDRAIINRIFDPYFTTKEVGKGTGMGLAVVHGIVKTSGGAIRVSSAPGCTEFHLYLPRVDAIPVVEAITFDRRQLPGGREHILLVDDEEMLVFMMQQTLEQLGYKVTGFTRSEAAHRAFEANPHSYDILITDMTMPGMTGTSLARAVKQLRNIPVILCTGYNEQIDDENAQSLGIQALIMKPVGMQQLAKTIRNVLEPLSSERRKASRFRAPAGTYVFLRSHPQRRFNLLDIGLNGLSYCHDLEDMPRDGQDNLSLMVPGGEFFISGISCRNVSDVPLVEIGNDNTCGFRRGVRFEDLNEMHIELLTQFIQNHATEILH